MTIYSRWPYKTDPWNYLLILWKAFVEVLLESPSKLLIFNFQHVVWTLFEKINHRQTIFDILWHVYKQFLKPWFIYLRQPIISETLTIFIRLMSSEYVELVSQDIADYVRYTLSLRQINFTRLYKRDITRSCQLDFV